MLIYRVRREAVKSRNPLQYSMEADTTNQPIPKHVLESVSHMTVLFIGSCSGVYNDDTSLLYLASRGQDLDQSALQVEQRRVDWKQKSV